mmetsp:Transcript_39304/g.59396  ORF Transcript_39304/g.59396 Transcript_39304/m.59396 type:complete len:151 (+) Transcript_39304:421-873(+)
MVKRYTAAKEGLQAAAGEQPPELRPDLATGGAWGGSSGMQSPHTLLRIGTAPRAARGAPSSPSSSPARGPGGAGWAERPRSAAGGRSLCGCEHLLRNSCADDDGGHSSISKTRSFEGSLSRRLLRQGDPTADGNHQFERSLDSCRNQALG